MKVERMFVLFGSISLGFSIMFGLKFIFNIYLLKIMFELISFIKL